MKSVFISLSIADAEKAIAMYDLAKFGMELIPIPAMGGCVIAIREVTRGTEPLPTWRSRAQEKLNRIRAELQVRSVLRSLSLTVAGGDA